MKNKLGTQFCSNPCSFVFHPTKLLNKVVLKYEQEQKKKIKIHLLGTEE